MAPSTCGRVTTSRLLVPTKRSPTDIDAVWFDPDPHSRSGRSVRVIGYSYSRRTVLTVILVPREENQGYWGANGWEANSTDRRRYERGE